MLCGNYFRPASLVDFHPAFLRKIRLWYLTFRSILELHISHTSCIYIYWSNVAMLAIIGDWNPEKNQSKAANWHAMTRHFPCSAMIDAGWNSTQDHCLRGDGGPRDHLKVLQMPVVHMCRCHPQFISPIGSQLALAVVVWTVLWSPLVPILPRRYIWIEWNR